MFVYLFEFLLCSKVRPYDTNTILKGQKPLERMSGYGQSYLGISQQMSSPKVLPHPRELHTGHSGRWMSFKGLSEKWAFVGDLGCKSNVAICHPLWIYFSTVVSIADLIGEVNLSIESVSLKYYPSIKRISSEYWLSILKILEYSVTVASAQSQKISQSKSPDLTIIVFYRQIK